MSWLPFRIISRSRWARIQAALHAWEQLNEQLVAENIRLKDELADRITNSRIVRDR